MAPSRRLTLNLTLTLTLTLQVGLPKPWLLAVEAAHDTEGTGYRRVEAAHDTEGTGYRAEAAHDTEHSPPPNQRHPDPAHRPRSAHTNTHLQTSLTARFSPYFLSRAYTYLSYSASNLLQGANASATSCIGALWRFRRAIEDDPRFARLPDPQLITMVPYVPLW